MGKKVLGWFGGLMVFFLVLGIAMMPLEEDTVQQSAPSTTTAVGPGTSASEKLDIETENIISSEEQLPQEPVSAPVTTSKPEGESIAGGTTASEPAPTPTPTPTPTPEPVITLEQADYVLNINSGKFHIPSCPSVDLMNESNKRFFVGIREEVLQQGFKPCQNCNP